MRKYVIMLVAMLVLAVGAEAAEYGIDASHSSVGFKVKHMLVSNVRGSFNDFAGSFTFVDGMPEEWSVNAEIQMTSVDTGDEKRDDHLRNADFFDVEKFPVMTFKSTKIVPAGGDSYTMHGDLTMHGVTKPVALDLTFNGAITDPWGNARAGFEASGKINRQDFGITWSKSMDGGGLVVGDDVHIMLEIEGVQKK
jgi:polyisoprenoid-binding protein YceI